GADTMRLYEMFIGDFEKSAPWNPQSIKGCKRFLERFAGLTDLAKGKGVTPSLEKSFHKTVKKVTEDIDGMKFNTAIAAMMSLINEIYDVGALTIDELALFAKILSPFAPHLAEEVYEACGGKGLVSLAAWPDFDESKTADNEVDFPIQINGKVRAVVTIPASADKDEILARAKADEKIAAALEGKTVVKEIVVPGKIVNIVVR
ncbi:MAG: class I tRNA ligase family protein, partial [Clostridia bacterium]|nr:class I tRNA ligase family protein [Clostridia bacterium]